ncbi:uncharacterized protein LOC127806435 isoform X1 [Diospyros lotus]|uniref:uncharacterized protein LOC127806435 isoform X1 n=2 Tax=Diospyros lotus TaxID=55363 RepID=UPI002250B873|nr:uncharacterized protein LOC127806435 isoform X1 [Diospyros lotus]XP_052199701.1 uncharacterized protein LOC127806435 isoform X1 [Diospyros lotus]XP_052199710.1 uncharacterized protein LOC127806435 isoform X1 [Diospyros lotus]
MGTWLVLSELLLLLSVFLSGVVFSKECTNVPTALSSHTVRYELSISNNETWKKEMYSHYHLIHTDDSAWSNLLPRKILREEEEFNWMLMYRKMKNSGGFNVQGDFLKEVSLHDVRLDPESKHGQAQQTNLEYLLLLDVDSLVWSFRKTAGLETPGKPYGGWEDPTCELRGHFVGHYLSASAQMWASTHNDTLKKKMTAVVSALSACQDKMGTGYLSAFPSELFDRFEAIKPVWAPYYTIHKILAGLLDQHLLAGNPQALKMQKWMVEYFYNRVQNVIAKYSIERHWLSLNEETGGMNDVLYRLFAITGDPKHLLLAHLFDKPCFLGLLAVKADDISGFHANTHIPVVIGSQMRYEVTGDSLYKEIGIFFMDIVNSSHSYVTGGTSVSEFWSDPKRLASTLQTENEESCTTYNMLKVSRHLFRWTKEMEYADYYERALTNGVLSIQRGREPGVMIYMLPLGRGQSKARSYHKWGTKFDSFWCCYGTGIESFSKLGDSIYFEDVGKNPGLYIIQYISSSLNWKSAQILLNQKVEPAVAWDPRLQVTLTVSLTDGLTSTLYLRIPLWTHSNGAKAAYNGEDLSLPTPGSFLSVTRKWSPGDTITLELPIILRTEAIKDDRPDYSSLQAILYGPYLLAGLTSGDWDINTGSASSLSDWITPIPANYNSHVVSISQKLGKSTYVLTNSNRSITMENFPEPGTDSSVHATFRLILKDTASSESFERKDPIGNSVMLEPIDLPGMVVVQQGREESLAVVDSADAKGSVFRVVAGLDGSASSVSLESESWKGCFIYGGLNYQPGSSIKLSCRSGFSDGAFEQATSFTLEDGIAHYHPMSFIAKGMKRHFLLAPLFSLRDESYTVYFNVQS